VPGKSGTWIQEAFLSWWVEDKRKGSPRKLVFGLKREIGVVLVVQEGMSMADAACILGVTRSAIWSAIRQLLRTA
jgi:hypothetical protein